jgi:membrane-bound metal-dependent hydrolase YbcI (DUF457 family)
MVEMNTMPSPFGHALGGVAAAWAIDLLPGARRWRSAEGHASFYRRAGGALTLICAALGTAPDADLVLTTHRTATHSLTAAVIVSIVAVVVTGWVTRPGFPVARVALMCGGAYAGHLLLDWLAVDHTPPFGLQMLWPFSRTWFISGLDVFVQTERRRLLSAESLRTNLVAIAWESAILLPVLLALWLVRVKSLARFSSQPARGDLPAQKRTRPVL